jgi:excisionase family DNA binding protein
VDPLLVRPEDAARALSLSRTTVYELLARGELASIKVGSARRIPVGALQAWIDRQQANIAQEVTPSMMG